MKPLARFLIALAVMVVPLAAQQAAEKETKVDVTGEWDLSVESPQGTMAIVATYKQDGEKLTGKHVNEMGEVPLEGTVKGNEISYTISIDFQGQSFTITHTGKIEGDTMTGTANLGGMGTTNWTAKRKK